MRRLSVHIGHGIRSSAFSLCGYDPIPIDQAGLLRSHCEGDEIADLLYQCLPATTLAKMVLTLQERIRHVRTAI